MPTWGGILAELQAAQAAGNPSPYDNIRRKYLVELHQYTNRAVILYATKFVAPGSAPPEMLSINDEDLQGLMEVFHGINCPDLDLILHSPGGSIDATEGLVLYMRSKFDNIRVIVPNLAMSAATMIACAADRIVMGKHSFLGPIDPQFVINTELGRRSVSAEEISEQFEEAQRDCADPAKMGAWIPILKSYGPDILIKCQHACSLSKSLAHGWLSSYMFKGQANSKKKADKIADWLAKHKNSKSHGRHLSRDELLDKGLTIDKLEDDQQLQEKVLSVFHATNHTFNATPALKIIENHLGRAFVKTQQQVQIPIQQLQQVQIPIQQLQQLINQKKAVAKPLPQSPPNPRST
ncbi:MAG: SDH family Clp fold serine proteinase [Verrucomicrobiales bacterium]